MVTNYQCSLTVKKPRVKKHYYPILSPNVLGHDHRFVTIIVLMNDACSDKFLLNDAEEIQLKVTS